MRQIFFLQILLIITTGSFLYSQHQVLEKTMDDDNTKYTNVGNIGLTITNSVLTGMVFHSGRNNRRANILSAAVLSTFLTEACG